VYVTAIPSTYARDSAKALRAVTLLPWLAIIPERIGTIGNTQGVNESSKPRPKNVASTRSRLPLWINRASRSCSEMTPPEVGLDDLSAEASIAGRESFRVFVIGG